MSLCMVNFIYSSCQTIGSSLSQYGLKIMKPIMLIFCSIFTVMRWWKQYSVFLICLFLWNLNLLHSAEVQLYLYNFRCLLLQKLWLVSIPMLGLPFTSHIYPGTGVSCCLCFTLWWNLFWWQLVHILFYLEILTGNPFYMLLDGSVSCLVEKKKRKRRRREKISGQLSTVHTHPVFYTWLKSQYSFWSWRMYILQTPNSLNT